MGKNYYEQNENVVYSWTHLIASKVQGWLYHLEEDVDGGKQLKESDESNSCIDRHAATTGHLPLSGRRRTAVIPLC